MAATGFPRAGCAVAVAMAILAATLAPREARALKFVRGTPVVEPADVPLSRTVTLRVELEDESGGPVENLAVEVFPEPPSVVRLESAAPPVSLTCTTGGRYSGSWVFRAQAPGQARFRVTAYATRCADLTVSSAEKTSPPLSIRPVEIGSVLRISPRMVAPGDEVEVALVLVNEGRDSAQFGVPKADPDHPGLAAVPLGPARRSTVEPPEAVKNGRISLAPGATMTFRWWFPAREPGQCRVTIIGAGLLIKSPPVLVRPAGRLVVSMEVPKVPGAEAREYEFRGRVTSVGGVAVARPRLTGGVSPDGSVRLVSAELSSTATLLPEEGTGLVARVELLKPGTVCLSVTIQGEEADSGRMVSCTEKAWLEVLPPTDLVMKVVPQSLTVLTGTRLDFTIEAYNPTASAAQNLTPVLLLKKGKAEPKGFQPMFLTVGPRSRAKFRGSLVPTEAGQLQFAVSVTARGERGGRRISAVSPVVSVAAVPAPRFVLTPLAPRLFMGATSPLRFLVTNTVSDTVSVKGAGVSLSGEGFSGAGARSIKSGRMVMAPGASATLTVQAFFSVASAPYWVQGAFLASGTVGKAKLPFTAGTPQRWLTLACPLDAGLVLPGADTVFVPPVMAVEWSLTRDGEAAVEIVAAGGRVVRAVRGRGRLPRGFHSAVWSGEGDDGALVPPGRYVLRLSGPLSGTTGTPLWMRERAVEVRK